MELNGQHECEVIVRFKAERFEKKFREIRSRMIVGLRLKAASLWYDGESDNWYIRFRYRYPHAAAVAWQRQSCVRELESQGIGERMQLSKKEALPTKWREIVSESA